MDYLDDTVQIYEVVYVLRSLLWAKLTGITHQLIHNINVIVTSEMPFSCMECDYWYSESSSSYSDRSFSCTECDYSSCINNVESKREFKTVKVYFLVYNSSTVSQLNIEGKILHYNICLYIYRLCMSHIVGLLYSEYEYIPGILIQVSQHITIIRLTRIMICNKMNTKWENGQQLIYILKWRYKIA